MTAPDDEGFLARWSRRKRATAAGKPVPAEPPAAAEAVAGEEGNAPAAADAAETATARDGAGDGELLKRVLTEADFADVDFAALDFKSDYTRFMQQGVPDVVRNKALRQLWASDPIMANMDGLHDYWDDYTDAAVAVPAGTLKTAYRIGKGFLSDAEVAEWEALGKPVTEPAIASAAAPAPGEAVTGDSCSPSVASDVDTSAARQAGTPPAQPVETAALERPGDSGESAPEAGVATSAERLPG